MIRTQKSIWLVPIVIVVLIAIISITTRLSRNTQNQIALQVKRAELVDAMRISLAQACEAGNSAVLANVPEDSQAFADQGRLAINAFAKARGDLEELLKDKSDKRELELLERVTQTFNDFLQIEPEMQTIAVQNSNSKAFELAFGAGKKALDEMDSALTQITVIHRQQPSEAGLRIVHLASETRLSALRIQSLLAPHIAEESDQVMDELEAQFADKDHTIRTNLENLRKELPTDETVILQAATTSYEEYQKLLAEIIRLSRENTEVRSVAIALTERRQAMLACQDALAELKLAIRPSRMNH